MTATLRYLGRITDEFFVSRMQRAARRISAASQLFPR
jgi:hypothetical protein